MIREIIQMRLEEGSEEAKKDEVDV